MKSLNIIDIGARFGIHPSNIKLKNIANHHLIEADNTEYSRLRKIYKNNSNVKIYSEVRSIYFVMCVIFHIVFWD